VAAHFGLDTEERKRHGHSSGVAKFLAVELACRLTGVTQREIGELGGASFLSAADEHLKHDIGFVGLDRSVVPAVPADAVQRVAVAAGNVP
jgi:hypothetical protein